MHNLILNWFVALEILLLLMLLLPRTLPIPHYDQTDNLYVVFVACNWQLTVHLAAGESTRPQSPVLNPSGIMLMPLQPTTLLIQKNY